MNVYFTLQGNDVISHVDIQSIDRKWVLVQACCLSHLSVCLSVCLSVGRSVYRSVQLVNCGKMADWSWMPFGVVSGVGRDSRDGCIRW